MDTTFDICPECGGKPERNEAHGEIVCSRCGLILCDNLIDQGQDWRNFEGGKDNAHAEPTSIMASSGGKGNTLRIINGRDGRGRKLDSFRLRRLNRLQRTNNWYMREVGSKRSLSSAIAEIKKLCSLLGLSEDFHELFCGTYRKFVKKNGLRGRSVKVTCAAIAYAECKQAGFSRTLDEISEISGVKRRELGRAYRLLCQKLKIKRAITDPVEYVDRFGFKLGLTLKSTETAKRMLTNAMNIYVGKSPVSLAASALYLAADSCGEHCTQKNVSEVSGITEVTVRKICRLMQSKAVDTKTPTAKGKSEA